MLSDNKYQIRYFPWHPVLFAVFPALALLAHNISEISSNNAIRSLIISVLVTLILVVSLYFLIKDWNKASLISTIALVLFFSYGHVYNILEPITLAGINIGRHRILTPIYLAILGISAWRAGIFKQDLRSITQALNILSIALLMYPVLGITTFYLNEAKTETPDPSTDAQILHLQGDGATPDVYFIVLDAYARDDVLKEHFDLDNSSFLDDLTEMGFYVTRCSKSNYAQTQLSLASTLNMEYIETLGNHYTQENTDRSGLPGLIKKSVVRRFLEQFGYVTVAFESGFYWTQLKKAAVYLTPQTRLTTLLGITGGLNGFEVLLVRTSAGQIWFDVASLLPEFVQPDFDYPKKVHRERILFTLDQLSKLPNMPGPKFVFAHIVSPHRPYVFGPDGKMVDQGVDIITGYRNQVVYLNSRLIPILRNIITNSDPPPIIVLQADHGGDGTAPEDRMSILNAYYLPDGGDQLLYENISPVNSFRVILNNYFGVSYELLEDVSYFSGYKTPYQYTVISDHRPGCTP